MERTKPPYRSEPDALAGDLLDRGLRLEHLGLDRLAWSESSRYQLDGRLSRARVRSLHGWTRRREVELRAAGAWIETEDEGIELPGYLTFNRSRADIEELRARGAKGGAATAAKNPPRAADGTFVPIGEGVCPVHELEWRPSTKRPGTYYCPAQAAEGESGYGRGKGKCNLTPDRTPNRPHDRDPGLAPSHAQGAKQVLGWSVGTDNDTNSVVRSEDGTAGAVPVSVASVKVRELDTSHSFDDVKYPDCFVCDRRVRRDQSVVVHERRDDEADPGIFGVVHDGWCRETFLAA